MREDSIFPVTRRSFAWLLALAGLGTACKKEEATTDTAAVETAEAASTGTPKRVADVHVHMFNANFLPIDGILRRWVGGGAAAFLAAILKKKTDDCSKVSSLSAAQANNALDQLEVPDDQLIEQIYRDTPPEAFADDEVTSGLSSVVEAPARRDAILAATPAQRKVMAKPEFVASLNQAANERPKDLFPERGGFLQWISLMTWCERKIWAAAQAAYPSVNLYITHMMDMENYYPPGKPNYDYPDQQVIRMLNLMKSSNGRLITFIAFDPQRENWREIMDDALGAGCAGVKFYPPNGYPPFDETTSQVPPSTAEFFRYCIEKDVPVFTHCTPHGFEAEGGHGKKYANPVLWRKALEQPEFRNLRLCLGHAGGEEGWFPKEGGPTPATAPFSAEVINLCKRFPNVYCEVAYLDEILTTEGQTRFQNAMRRAMQAPGEYDFGKKLMYGSDWHMIHKIGKHRQYLPSFIATFRDAEWNAIRDDVFFDNAVRWLNLGKYVQRLETENPQALPASAITYLRGIADSVSAT
ncbi:MAG TPA: amidohydrolase family protein [Thermoanaerobaculia bacterium]